MDILMCQDSEKTKPNKANSPSFGRKSEALSSTTPALFPDACCPAFSRKSETV
jgi:hypothetical protein